MTESNDSLTEAIDGQLDQGKLDTLADEISEVLFDWSETSTMQRKIEDRLLDQVSRILHRCEERPDRLREVEQGLMNMDDADLGIAILRQSFHIHSEHTQECIVNQLVRLANSLDQKTSQLTTDALHEAAYSENARLQSIGCKALFRSNRLSSEELREFARAEYIDFPHRLGSVQHLVETQSLLAPGAYLDLVRGWDSAARDRDNQYSKPLHDLATAFHTYDALDSESVARIVDELFEAVDRNSLGQGGNRMVQRAMASLPEQTIKYLQVLPLGRRSGPAAIFTLGACARRSTVAVRLLIKWGREIAASTEVARKVHPLRWIATRLRNVRIEDSDIVKELDELVDELMADSQFADVTSSFIEAKERRQTRGQRLFGLLDAIAEKIELDEEPSEKELWNLKHAFQREHRRVRAADLTWSKREALLKSMELTAKTSSWKSSADTLRSEYSLFDGKLRLAIQDAIGFVALGEKDIVKTRAFQRYQTFFEGLMLDGSPHEAQRASEWLERLGEVDTLPEAPK